MKKTLIFDTECYRNHWLLSFRNVESRKLTFFEVYNGSTFDADKLRKILGSYRIVGFNSNHYDLPMIFVALKSQDNENLKKASDLIINNDFRYWQIEEKFGFRIPQSIDHIDLIEVAPGKASLKLYGGRMHAGKLQDLPYVPDEEITDEKRESLIVYNINDLDTTELLYKTLEPQLALREVMSMEYQMDLRSKSDAQIAEAVIKSQIKKMTGVEPAKVDIAAGTVYRYRKPPFITFSTPEMREAERRLCECDYIVSGSGKMQMPAGLDKELIRFGDSSYRVGMGGLHSCEESVSYTSDDDYCLVDRDVASYYPAIIINCGLFPKHIGPDFLTVYKKIMAQRLAAKKEGRKVEADSKKLALNGSFGKLGSRWSPLYSPDLLIQTTVTGQLCLLMLIETLELAGAAVVSANTDGVVFRCRCDSKHVIDRVITEWEQITGFVTEETRYKALYCANVNNYLAIKEDGTVKMKGAYTPAGLQKNPTSQICTDAVIAHLKKDVPIEDTIRGCDDVRKFISVRTVKGGAMKGDDYLGKAIRWYYRSGETGTINYKLNGYIVPKSEGAWPLMSLPETLPDDIDYDWYVREANSIIDDIGASLT